LYRRITGGPPKSEKPPQHELRTSDRCSFEGGLAACHRPRLSGFVADRQMVPPAGWRIPFGEGGALVLARHDTRKTLILKTVLGPGMAGDTAAA
jgi:hypothetical protein